MTTSLASVTLEVADVAAAERFYAAAFGLGPRLRLRAGEAPTSGFRGFSLSLTVAQPADVDAYLGAALRLGAKALKPASKSLWGYGGVVQAPDGTIWKAATSAKKDSGPAKKEFNQIVLLLGAEDVKASKQFYVEQGLTVGKSFGGKYVEFTSEESAVKLALYKRRGLAKDVGVDAEGSGSHRIVLNGTTATPFTDPDGFTWEPAPVASPSA
ncbi:glyoxalase [Streptomyces sp. NPDC046939]|uniref:glyoxalase n=1 Tax=Streptomyces sp. NPDC046939 TaxID=3155376 RepID=UPI0033CA5FE6